MRIPINLSTEPFRRDRPLLVASIACAIALALTLGAQLYLIVAERGRVKDTRASVAQLTTELKSITNEQAQLDATLRQPGNAEVLQRSLLLNTILDRKSISWTRIFADLETVLPPNVRIISIRLPQITSQNEVVLDLQVGAQSPEPVLDLFVRLRKSPLFGPVDFKNSMAPTQNEPLYRYRFTVNYAQKL